MSINIALYDRPLDDIPASVASFETEAEAQAWINEQAATEGPALTMSIWQDES